MRALLVVAARGVPRWVGHRDLGRDRDLCLRAPSGGDCLADRIPVALDVGAERFDASVEATAYFVVAEDGRLVVTVSDDGVVGANGDGSGLTGLADRLAVIDGCLSVRENDARG